VVGRADLLATLFVLGGVWCHLRRHAAPPTQRVWWHAGTMISAALGPFAKESAVVLVPLVVGADWWLFPSAHRARRALTTGATLLIALIPWAAARQWTLAHEWAAEASAIDNPLLSAPVLVRIATAVKVLGWQLITLVWPARLSVDYSFDAVPLVTSVLDPAWLAAAAVVTLLVSLGMAAARRVPAFGFALTAYVLAILPTANLLVPVGAIMADRFLYLPSAIAAWALAVGLDRLPATSTIRNASVAGVLTIAVIFGALAARRNHDWQSDERLWASAVAVVPRSAKAHRGYAAALFTRSGPTPAVLEHANVALSILPDFHGALADLGRYRQAEGDRLADGQDLVSARRAWRRAITALAHARRLDRRANRRGRRATAEAGTPAIFHQLGQVHSRLGHYAIAAAAFRQAQRFDPWQVYIPIDLSAAHALAGQFDAAAVALWMALSLDERHRDATERLVEIYRRLEPRLVTRDAKGLHLALDALPVRLHRCDALTRLGALFSRARLPEPAAEWRRRAAIVCSR
jgi:protein O-mannosyl-transferase